MHNRTVIVVFICLLAMSQIIAVSAATSQDRAVDFIENVLPIDSSLWHVELKVDSNATGTRELLDRNNISASENDRVLLYFLGSMVGTADGIDVIFIIRESHFIQGAIDISNAPSYSAFGHPLEVANVTNFLAKYQNWSELDSTKMIEMLSNVNQAQNTSISSGGLTMTITCIDSTTKLSWTLPESHKFEIAFKNYFPTYFYDDRQINSNIPIPTPTLTPTPPPEDRNPPHLEPIDYLLPVSVILAVVSILLILLFRYHQKTANLTK